MKRNYYYFIIFLGLLSVIFEAMYDYPQMKYLYATFYPEKYFKKDELTNWEVYNDSDNEGTDLSSYKGVLKLHKVVAQVRGRDGLISSLMQSDGSIRVWFMQIGNAKVTVLRTSDAYPKPTSAIKAYTHIFLFLYALLAIYRLIKLKNNQK